MSQYLLLFLITSCVFILFGAMWFFLPVKKDIHEGIANPINAIKDLGKQIKEIPKIVKGVGDEIKNVGDEVQNIGDELKSVSDDVKNMPKKILTPIEKKFEGVAKDLAFFKKAWLVVVRIFKALFSYLECGFDMVKNLPNCWYYYALNAFGNLLYLPIHIIVWAFSLSEIENAVWDYIEEADDMVHDATGFHFIDFPDSVTKKCYSCKVTPMPKI